MKHLCTMQQLHPADIFSQFTKHAHTHTHAHRHPTLSISCIPVWSQSRFYTSTATVLHFYAA